MGQPAAELPSAVNERAAGKRRRTRPRRGRRSPAVAQLLQPLLSKAIGKLDPEDRVLIKMLLMDEVPQKQLADSFGIHSGNLTRRKQRIAGGIWQSVQQLAQATARPKRVEECLQLAPAGPDRELKQRLGQVLSQALTAAGGTEEFA